MYKLIISEVVSTAEDFCLYASGGWTWPLTCSSHRCSVFTVFTVGGLMTAAGSVAGPPAGLRRDVNSALLWNPVADMRTCGWFCFARLLQRLLISRSAQTFRNRLKAARIQRSPETFGFTLILFQTRWASSARLTNTFMLKLQSHVEALWASEPPGPKQSASWFYLHEHGWKLSSGL